MFSSADDVLSPAAFGGHVPVLFRETLELLSPRVGAKLLDGTFGGGGHTRALLSAAEGVTLVATDRDPDAQVRAQQVSDELLLDRHRKRLRTDRRCHEGTHRHCTHERSMEQGQR